jgi:hypothetical protein
VFLLNVGSHSVDCRTLYSRDVTFILSLFSLPWLRSLAAQRKELAFDSADGLAVDVA